MILENAKESYLSGIEDFGVFNPNYLPIYAVKDSNNNRFEYTVKGGKIEITA